MENTKKERKINLYLIIIGLISGLINGFFGGGGGMIVVPLLIYLTKFSEKEAHATAILIILPLTIISGILYSVFGSVKINMLIPITIGVTMGGIIGALLLKKISNRWIQMVFSVVMELAGIFMLVL